MNKKQLITAILSLAAVLEIDIEKEDLNSEKLESLEVKELKVLHSELSEKKAALDEEQNKTNVATKKQEKVVLKFLAPYKRYSNGDIAGFSEDEAKRILAFKPVVAEEYAVKNAG